MARLASSLLAAIPAAALTLGVLYVNDRARAREAAHLRTENGRLRLEATQRHALQVSPPAGTARSSTPSSEPPLPRSQRPVALVPQGDYRNEGQTSPLDTLQTFAWACDQGDSNTMKELLCFEGDGRAKAAAFMATLAPETRARWGSPESMAAELLTHQGMQQPFPPAQVLDRAVPEPMADGRVKLRLPGTPKDGTLYQKIGDRWHYVITEAAVDRYIADQSRRKSGAD